MYAGVRSAPDIGGPASRLPISQRNESACVGVCKTGGGIEQAPCVIKRRLEKKEMQDEKLTNEPSECCKAQIVSEVCACL